MIDTNEMRRKTRLQLTTGYDFLALCDEIDRLRMGQYEKKMGEALCGAKPKPQGKTVRVRFPGMIDGNGEVIINNYHRDRKGVEHHSVSSWPRSTIFWLTADLSIPEETTVEAEVENV